MARPNVLMFGMYISFGEPHLAKDHQTKVKLFIIGDFEYKDTREDGQLKAYRNWQKSLNDDSKLVIIEVGAGIVINDLHVPSSLC